MLLLNSFIVASVLVLFAISADISVDLDAKVFSDTISTSVASTPSELTENV